MQNRHIIYITGESGQGKTIFANKLGQRLGAFVISGDKAYNYVLFKEKNSEAEFYQRDLKHTKDKKEFYLAQRFASEDFHTVIIEGASMASQKERDFINDIFNPEFDYLLKIDTSNHQVWSQKKLGKPLTRQYLDWFESIYNEHEKTYVIEDVEEVFTRPIYQERSDILGKFETIDEDKSFWKGKKVLDIGCAGGKLFPLLAFEEIQNYTGIDTNWFELELAIKDFPEARFRLADVLEHQNSYDTVIALSILHSFPDDVFEKILEKYSKSCDNMIIEYPVIARNDYPYFIRTEKKTREIAKKYFSKVIEYGVSPSPHDPHSKTAVRKAFRLIV